MAKAIKARLPQTRHWWCRWHVLENCKEKLGNVYSKYSGFKKAFKKLVTYETCKRQFEMQWHELVTSYKLQKNKFMKWLFKYRGEWARPYFMGVFCAGMTSTQRSESANHMLKRVIQQAAPMHLFVSKFNELRTNRHDDEGKECHITRQVIPCIYSITLEIDHIQSISVDKYTNF